MYTNVVIYKSYTPILDIYYLCITIDCHVSVAPSSGCCRRVQTI